MELARHRSLMDRMIGAAMLDIGTYEEVEADTSATAQAAIVVGLVAVASAVAGYRAGINGVLSGVIGAYVGWAIWSAVTYMVGTWLGGTATWGEMLRTIGFAQSPGVLLILGVVPLLGGLVRLVVAVWLLVAVIIAIRQALDFGTGKAVLTAVIGFILYIVAAAVISLLFHIPIGR